MSSGSQRYNRMKTQTGFLVHFRTKKGKIPEEKLSRRQCDSMSGIFKLFIEKLNQEVALIWV